LDEDDMGGSMGGKVRGVITGGCGA
jgi:hypothetical protein